MVDLAYNELFKKYQDLLEENRVLKTRIKELELKSFVSQDKPLPNKKSSDPIDYINQSDSQTSKKGIEIIETEIEPINKNSDNQKKIRLFMSLFRGRSDVYAKRWVSKKGKSGYSPVCSNEWLQGICFKPKVKCAKCDQRSYPSFNKTVTESHLRGKYVIGIYPMNLDETCHFLAMDFDKEGWQNDIGTVRQMCETFEIPFAIERSRSGNGGHVWFFFKEPIQASIARKFGASLLTKSMEKRHKISFHSYDRLFPNQDTMPKGGLGNLIALPLQKSVRENNNSVFVDEHFQPYKDQWAFLCTVDRLSEKEIGLLISNLSKGNELGVLKKQETDKKKPWIRQPVVLKKKDFPQTVDITNSGMLYIKKEGLSQKALNSLKRLAAFQNPEFYKKQAMRMPTFNIPRIISCSEDFDEYLALPRGCEEDIIELLKKQHIKSNWVDKRDKGKKIKVEFQGLLRQEQQDAFDALVAYDSGVLSATTAFGKTVVGASLIGHKKVNTLVLVHRQQLLAQWKKRLSEFLLIHEKLPESPQKRGRKKKLSLIGQLGGGKNQLSSIVDIAIMQSLNRAGKVKECIKDYGMIIVDECHHISAVSFEQILKSATARYVYGLTATPSRPDGHHPIIFFHCGPIRFNVNAKQQAEKRPFEHYLIPRFTNFRTGLGHEKNELTIQEVYSTIIEDDIRNQTIIDDVVDCYKNGRTSLVITGRVAHVNALGKALKGKIADVFLITGGMGVKKTADKFNEIASLPENRPFVLVATGSFIGEGFDEPRLDTLFLAMPIAWKGTLQQYAGRLHRLCDGKRDVQIYDYVDVHVKMLENMYGKRLKGYASIGYKAKVNSIPDSPTEVIFTKESFFPVYLNDIENSTMSVFIVSPFVTKRRVLQMLNFIKEKIEHKVAVTILTRPVEEFNEKKKAMLEEIFSILQDVGIQLVFKQNIHQKFAIIDERIVWFGSINLLSFGYSEESIMRLVSGSIAYELSSSIGL